MLGNKKNGEKKHTNPLNSDEPSEFKGFARNLRVLPGN